MFTADSEKECLNCFTSVYIKTETTLESETEDSEKLSNTDIQESSVCDILKLEFQNAETSLPLLSSVKEEVRSNLNKKEEIFEEDVETYALSSRYNMHLAMCNNFGGDKSGLIPRRKKIFKTLHCNKCNCTFKQKPRLENHVQECDGIKRHGVQCEICQKIFKYKSGYNLHKLVHAGIKKYECDVCHKYFSVKYNLAKHLIIHEGIKNYMCGCCGKCFFLNSDLKNHMMIHKSIKKYHCFICEKYFTYKHDLRRHLSRHDGTVKSLVCPVCYQRFSEKRYLRNHILKH